MMSLNQEGTEPAPHAPYGLVEQHGTTAKIGEGGKRNPAGKRSKGKKGGPDGGSAVPAHMKYHKPTTKRRALKVNVFLYALFVKGNPRYCIVLCGCISRGSLHQRYSVCLDKRSDARTMSTDRRCL